MTITGMSRHLCQRAARLGDSFLGVRAAPSSPLRRARRSLSASDASSAGDKGIARRFPFHRAGACGCPAAGTSRHCRCRHQAGGWGCFPWRPCCRSSASATDRRGRQTADLARSSSAPGPSPTNTSARSGFPDPKTMLLRASHKRQRRQSPMSVSDVLEGVAFGFQRRRE